MHSGSNDMIYRVRHYHKPSLTSFSPFTAALFCTEVIGQQRGIQAGTGEVINRLNGFREFLNMYNISYFQVNGLQTRLQLHQVNIFLTLSPTK